MLVSRNLTSDAETGLGRWSEAQVVACGAEISIRRVYSIDKSPARRSCWNDGGGGAQVLRLLVLAIAATFRPKALRIAENLCLRQQLVVLQRRHPRPRLSDTDRAFGSWQADGSAIGRIRC